MILSAVLFFEYAKVHVLKKVSTDLAHESGCGCDFNWWLRFVMQTPEPSALSFVQFEEKGRAFHCRAHDACVHWPCQQSRGVSQRDPQSAEGRQGAYGGCGDEAEEQWVCVRNSADNPGYNTFKDFPTIHTIEKATVWAGNHNERFRDRRSCGVQGLCLHLVGWIIRHDECSGASQGVRYDFSCAKISRQKTEKDGPLSFARLKIQLSLKMHDAFFIYCSWRCNHFVSALQTGINLQQSQTTDEQ